MTPKLWITEKPNAAKDLVAGLCLAFGADSSYEKFSGTAGFYRLTSGDIIMPLTGHMLQSVRPGEYLSDEHAAIEKAYQYEKYATFLPILPSKLKKVPKLDYNPKTGKYSNSPSDYYKMAAKLIKSAKEIVNAGDIDREGQLIVDELLEHLGIDPYGTKPVVHRVGMASNVPQDIADMVRRPMEKNGDQKWRDRCSAALARERVDYVWGMNLSMVGQAVHKAPRVSVGRVQTPTLNIVAMRDAEIEGFKPTKYFVPVITLADGTEMRWQERVDSIGLPGFDSSGRIVDEQLGRQIVQRIVGGEQGQISLAETKKHAEKPPLPYSLSTLQSACSKELELDLPAVKSALDNLYLKHKAISYIGTDCRYLPESMHAKGADILRSLGAVMTKQAAGADVKIKSGAFNDAKLDEHYAIAPTGILPNNPSPEERSVFGVVARRFIAQFYPDHVFERTKIVADFGKDKFASSTIEVLQSGWKDVERHEDSGDSREVGGQKDAHLDDDQEVLS